MSTSYSLIGLQWLAKVTKDDADEFVTLMRDRLPQFELFTVPKAGQKVIGFSEENEQPVYVLSDIYPQTKSNLELLGFYSLRPRFQRIAAHIESTGLPAISDKVRLLQDGIEAHHKKDGLLVYHPVFNYNKQEMIGVVVGVIRLSTYFDGLVSRTASDHRLYMKVTDLGFDAEDDPILFQSPDWDSIKGIEIEKRLSLPNRDWKIDFKFSEPIASNIQWILVALSVGGLIISILLGYVVYLLMREKLHLSEMLEERTEELRFLADHDSLTGLYNRRAFGRLLQENVLQKKAFSLVMFDVDDFKLINDNHSHIAGDEMLIHITTVISRHMGNNDVLARLGGDEFCIICELSELQPLQCYLETLRAAVESTGYEFMDEVLYCTLSIGAAINHTYDQESLLHLADSKLYESKENGRNRVSIAQ
ncbi:sensor domain-containing diguanylate cyclase [Vibrio anguillarum]|nr:sensor domain-containing diguanylate cyclase [Vibrio anguillarum]